MSPGSTGAPAEVACKVALLFSSSDAITETRPLRFLIVRRTLPPAGQFLFIGLCLCLRA